MVTTSSSGSSSSGVKSYKTADGQTVHVVRTSTGSVSGTASEFKSSSTKSGSQSTEEQKQAVAQAERTLSSSTSSPTVPIIAARPTPLKSPDSSTAYRTGAAVTQTNPYLAQTRQYIDDQLRDKGIDPTGKSSIEKVRLLNMASGSSQEATRLYLANKGIKDPTVTDEQGNTRFMGAAESQLLRQDIEKVQPFKFQPRPQEQDIRAAQTFTRVPEPYQKGDVIYSGTTDQQLAPSQPAMSIAQGSSLQSTQQYMTPVNQVTPVNQNPSFLERARSPLFPSAYGAEETATVAPQTSIPSGPMSIPETKPVGQFVGGYSSQGKEYEIYAPYKSGPTSTQEPKGVRENLKSVLTTVGLDKVLNAIPGVNATSDKPIESIRIVNPMSGKLLDATYGKDTAELQKATQKETRLTKAVDYVTVGGVKLLNKAEEYTATNKQYIPGPIASMVIPAKYVADKLTGKEYDPTYARKVESALLFSLPKSVARTTEATGRLVTGRDITVGEGLDIGFTAVSLTYGGARGAVQGALGAAESVAVKSTVAKAAPSVVGQAAKSVLIGTLGAQAAYSVVTAPDPTLAAIDLGADIAKYGFAAEVGARGGYTAAEAYNRPRGPPMNLRVYEGKPYSIIEVSKDGKTLTTKTDIVGERVSKNLRGQEFVESAKGTVASSTKLKPDSTFIITDPVAKFETTIVRKQTGRSIGETFREANANRVAQPLIEQPAQKPTTLKQDISNLGSNVKNKVLSAGETVKTGVSNVVTDLKSQVGFSVPPDLTSGFKRMSGVGYTQKPVVPEVLQTPRGSKSVLYDIQKTEVRFKERVDTLVEPTTYEIYKTDINGNRIPIGTRTSPGVYEFRQTGVARTTSLYRPDTTFYQPFAAKGGITLGGGKSKVVVTRFDASGNVVPAVKMTPSKVKIRGNIYKMGAFESTGKQAPLARIPEQSVLFNPNPKSVAQTYLAEGKLKTFSNVDGTTVIQTGKLKTQMIDVTKKPMFKWKPLNKRAEVSVGRAEVGELGAVDNFGLPTGNARINTKVASEIDFRPRGPEVEFGSRGRGRVQQRFQYEPKAREEIKQGGRTFTPNSGLVYSAEPIYGPKPIGRPGFLGVAQAGGLTRGLTGARVQVGTGPQAFATAVSLANANALTGATSTPGTTTTPATRTTTGYTPEIPAPYVGFPVTPTQTPTPFSPTVPVIGFGPFPQFRQGDGYNKYGPRANRQYAYQSSLSSNILGKKATKAQAQQLLSKKTFTGQEQRLII